MRRLLSLGLFAALVATAAACGDDGGGGQPDGDASGLLIGQEVADGDLADRLLVVDPDHPGTETVKLTDVQRGVPAGPGTAFYETETSLFLVDAEAAEAHDLHVDLTDADPGYSLGVVQGGGDRYVVLLSPTASAATLVDLQVATAQPLPLDGATLYYSAALTPDESRVLLNTDNGAWLLSTDDPQGDADRLADGAGQLTEDGSSVLLRPSADAIVVRNLATGAEQEIDGAGVDGVLAVGSRLVLVRGDEAVLVEPGSEDVIASAPFSADGPGPLAVPGSVLVPGPDGAWTLMDADAGAATPLPDLTGLVPAFSGVPPTRWVPFADSASLGGRKVVALDTDDGSVVTVLDLPRGEQVVGFPDVADAGPAALLAVDRAEGSTLLLADLDTGETTELGVHLQGAALSPAGDRVAWSGGDDPSHPTLIVAPVDDPGSAETVADGMALPLWLRGS